MERSCGRRPSSTRVTLCTAGNVTVNTISRSPHIATRKMPRCGSLLDWVQVASRPDWSYQGGRECYDSGYGGQYDQTWPSGPGSAEPSVAKMANKQAQPQTTMDTGPIRPGISASTSLVRGPRWSNSQLGWSLVFVVPAPCCICPNRPEPYLP